MMYDAAPGVKGLRDLYNREYLRDVRFALIVARLLKMAAAADHTAWESRRWPY